MHTALRRRANMYSFERDLIQVAGGSLEYVQFGLCLREGIFCNTHRMIIILIILAWTFSLRLTCYG